MIIKEIIAKSLLRKHKFVDSWFVSKYGFNIYRGCLHNCAYCDGRAEKYQVEGEFGKEIAVKINAPELLDRELNPANKRKPLKKGYIAVGGGVGDAYQPAEAELKMSRKVLEIIAKYDFPIHILTKSDAVLNDLDIIKEINQQTGARISFSFSSVDEKISRVFEPGVPLPKARLAAMSELRRNERIILEILRTGSSAYYEKMLY